MNNRTISKIQAFNLLCISAESAIALYFSTAIWFMLSWLVDGSNAVAPFTNMV